MKDAEEKFSGLDELIISDFKKLGKTEEFGKNVYSMINSEARHILADAEIYGLSNKEYMNYMKYFYSSFKNVYDEVSTNKEYKQTFTDFSSEGYKVLVFSMDVNFALSALNKYPSNIEYIINKHAEESLKKSKMDINPSTLFSIGLRSYIMLCMQKELIDYGNATFEEEYSEEGVKPSKKSKNAYTNYI